MPCPRRQTGIERGRVHVVRTGDDLWTLAERYYGQGTRLAPDRRRQPDGVDRRTGPAGGRLAAGHSRRRRARQGQAHDRPYAVATPCPSIAERVLGSASRWPELYRANRSQLSDPDDLPIGIRLVMPGEPTGREAGERRAEPDDLAGRASPRRPTRPRPSPTRLQNPSRHQPSRPPSHPPSPATTQPAISDRHSRRRRPARSGPARRWPRSAACSPPDWSRGWPGVAGSSCRPGRRVGGSRRSRAVTAPVATALGRQQRPLSLRTLDRAMRAIAAHCRTTRYRSAAAPVRRGLRRSDRAGHGRAGPRRSGRVHRATDAPGCSTAADAGYLASVPGDRRVAPSVAGPGHAGARRQGPAGARRSGGAAAAASRSRRPPTRARRRWRRWRSSCPSRPGPTR